MVCVDDGPAPRCAILKVAPPFLAVLIGRLVGIPSELRARPSSPRGASGPLGCTSKLNLPQGWSQDYSGSLRSANKPPKVSWTKSALTLAAPSAATQASASCKTGVTLRLACSVQTIDKRTEARPALPPRRSEAASAGACQQPERDISDQGVYSAAKRSNRCTSAAVVTPLLPKKPTPRPRHV